MHVLTACGGSENMAYSFETREKLWQNQGPDIFGAPSADAGGSLDQERLFRDLFNVNRAAIRIWWNIRSLEEYLRMEYVPRGLRVNIFPAWEATSEFQGIWEKGLSQCSRLLMNLLINHDKELLGTTRQRIKDLEAQIIQQGATIGDFQEKYSTDLEKYEKEIVTGKKRKFSRDKQDFEQKTMYRWRHQGNRRGQRNTTTPRNTGGNNTDLSSDFLSTGTSDTDGGREGEDEEIATKNPKADPKTKTTKARNKRRTRKYW